MNGVSWMIICAHNEVDLRIVLPFPKFFKVVYWYFTSHFLILKTYFIFN